MAAHNAIAQGFELQSLQYFLHVSFSLSFLSVDTYCNASFEEEKFLSQERLANHGTTFDRIAQQMDKKRYIPFH